MIQRADVVIPVKHLSNSKSRLSGILSPEDRQQLVLVMLEDVVTALCRSNLVDQITVLSPDERIIASATSLGVGAVTDPNQNGINESIALITGREILERIGVPLLVLPVDVPLVRSITIDNIIREVHNCQVPKVVISPSATGGTNALLRNPPDVIPTRYGVKSYDAHLQEAANRRIQVKVHRSEDLEHDVDTPADLYEVIGNGKSTKTSRFLRGILRADRDNLGGSIILRKH